MAAAKRATLADGQTKASQLRHVAQPVSQADAAEQFGVSRRTVQRATTVLKRGAPELVEATERGAIAVKQAAEIANKPVAEQREIVKLPTASQPRPAAALRSLQ